MFSGGIEMQHWVVIGWANLSELFSFYPSEIISEVIDGFPMISGEGIKIMNLLDSLHIESKT